jgi:hypothetical protein
MNEIIGHTAGAIWKFLCQQSKPVNLSTLKKNVDASSTLFMMGLGWLAREDKICIEVDDDLYSYKISLK